jgi:hypothetical protein
MIKARCCCGSLVAQLPGPTDLVVACHCDECQRRTGAPFGVNAYYPSDQVRIIGDATEYERRGSSGMSVRLYFCPKCGTTVYWRADKFSSLIGIAVGAIVDPQFPRPRRSVFEQAKHRWVQIDASEHFQQSPPTA